MRIYYQVDNYVVRIKHFLVSLYNTINCNIFIELPLIKINFRI